MTNSNFQIGQHVTYSVCNSIYEGIIVKINADNFTVIDCKSGMDLFNAGYSVGSYINISQIK